MIICPTCKEEIEDDSHYCDQCGQALVYCSNCGRVGKGRRCTYCGGLMVNVDELKHRSESYTSLSGFAAQSVVTAPTAGGGSMVQTTSGRIPGVPTLTLYNANLDIRMVGVNGAVIGRRQGPYVKFFEQNMYVSGVHAQLIYNKDTGWSIIDKHSSNGTQLNERELQPDVPMSLKNGDIVTIANISLQVNIN